MTAKNTIDISPAIAIAYEMLDDDNASVGDARRNIRAAMRFFSKDQASDYCRRVETYRRLRANSGVE